jgi:hypothetical protein
MFGKKISLSWAKIIRWWWLLLGPMYASNVIQKKFKVLACL